MTTPNILLGLLFGIGSGMLSGSYGVWMKKINSWNWENTWLTYSFWALLVFPLILAWATIPRFWVLFGSVPLFTLGLVFLFGAGWGLSNIGFGIGLRELGMALTAVIVIGIGNVMGTILPLIVYHPESFWKPVGLCINSGALISLLGIIMCSLESWPFDNDKTDSHPVPRKKSRHKLIIICVCSGILGMLFNFALIAGKPLEKQSLLQGALSQNASNATWFIALSGAFVVTAIYCCQLLFRNRSFKLFQAKKSIPNCLYNVLMGLIWFGGINLYGISVLYFGKYGPSIGWPIFQSIQIMAANLLGIATGEWKHLDRKTFYMRLAGIAILITGITVTSLAGKLA